MGDEGVGVPAYPDDLQLQANSFSLHQKQVKEEMIPYKRRKANSKRLKLE